MFTQGTHSTGKTGKIDWKLLGNFQGKSRENTANFVYYKDKNREIMYYVIFLKIEWFY